MMKEKEKIIMEFFIYLIVFGIGIGCIWLLRQCAIDERKSEEEREEKDRQSKELLLQYQSQYQGNGSVIPDNAQTVGNYGLRLWIWRVDNALYLAPQILNSNDAWTWHRLIEEQSQGAYKCNEKFCFPQKVSSMLDKYFISLERIRYFYEEGELRRDAYISGGGGGGTSVKGAAIGGLLAGETGAIIGSRKEVQPISTTYLTFDEREVPLFYVDIYGKEQVLTFNHEALRILRNIIPEKEFDVVHATQVAQMVEQTKGNGNVSDRMKQLVELREQGFLTEAEFSVKKEELLSSLTR